MNDTPIYVMVSFHESCRGALPINNIVKRLGGYLKTSTMNKETNTCVFSFSPSIYGRAFIKVIERADVGIIATALNSTDY